MGHHHHSHHHHHHHRPGRGLGGGPAQLGNLSGALSWPVLLTVSLLLFGLGALDGHATYRRYFHGQQAMAMITRAEHGSTILEVQGHVCAISGDHGRVGQMLPVAYPLGSPGQCILRRPAAFSFAGGMLLISLLLAGFALFRWRMAAAGPATDAPASPPRA